MNTHISAAKASLTVVPSDTEGLWPGPANSRGRGLDISLHALAKSFGDQSVLRGIDLEIPPGQFVAVVGRSGCGKSTLMRLVVGLEKPSQGEVRIAGRPVAGLQSDVRLMFQDHRLLPWQSVLSNVGIARGEAWREKAGKALQDVGLADRGQAWPSVLSGGQKQRVALARALVSDPGILLLDEPFGALDAMTRSEMHALLESIWRECGFTALLITHDVAEAVSLADRVLVLRDGGVTLDIAVDIPRPRGKVGQVRALELQNEILAAV